MGTQLRVLTEFVHRCTHFVKLIWTYVRTVREAEVDETPMSEEVLLGEGFALVC